jgi:hypothetical protein
MVKLILMILAGMASALDGMTTLIAIGLGIAVEANPLMNFFLSQGEVHFLMLNFFLPFIMLGILDSILKREKNFEHKFGEWVFMKISLAAIIAYLGIAAITSVQILIFMQVL